MARHDERSLWRRVRGECDADEARAVDAHLASCGACAQRFEDIRVTHGLLGKTAVPALDEQSWQRVRRGVMNRAAGELGRRPFPWWALGPVLAAAAAAGVLLLVRAPAPAQRLEVGAGLGTVTVRAAPEAERLAQVEPEPPAQKGERLSGAERPRWRALPAGVQAGLVPNSTVLVTEANERRVELVLERGAVLISAEHRPERELWVRVGEVSVRDVGTRFLVAEEGARVTVSVEEGEVEVLARSQRRSLLAGEQLALVDGRFEPTRPAGAPAVPAAPGALGARVGPTVPGASARTKRSVAPTAPGDRSPTAGAQLGAPEPAPLPPAPVAPGGSAVGGAPPEVPAAAPVPSPAGAAASPAAKAGSDALEGSPSGPSPAMRSTAEHASAVPPATAAPGGPPEDEWAYPAASGGSPPPKQGPGLKELADQLWSKLPRHVETPFAPMGGTLAEQRVREVERLADGQECQAALDASDRWLERHEKDGEPGLRRRVLLARARCLAKLGREAEAEAVRRQAERR